MPSTMSNPEHREHQPQIIYFLKLEQIIANLGGSKNAYFFSQNA